MGRKTTTKLDKHNLDLIFPEIISNVIAEILAITVNIKSHVLKTIMTAYFAVNVSNFITLPSVVVNFKDDFVAQLFAMEIGDQLNVDFVILFSGILLTASAIWIENLRFNKMATLLFWSLLMVVSVENPFIGENLSRAVLYDLLKVSILSNSNNRATT